MSDPHDYLMSLLGACARVVDVQPVSVPHSKRPKELEAKRLFYNHLRTHTKLGWIAIAATTGHTHPVAYALAGPRGRKRLDAEQVKQVEWWMADVEVPEEWRKHER